MPCGAKPPCMNFLQQIGRVLSKPVFSGYGGRGGWGLNGRYPSGGAFDYKREAGPLWESSIPFMCLKWEQRATVEAEIVVQGRDENGDWKNLPGHPLLDLLGNPNPFFDLHQLLDAVRFDYHLSGNAYLWKSRSASGKVVQLWWIPSWLIEPRWEETGGEFINCYEYLVNGQSFSIPVGDIIHFRNGIDPRSHGRKGLSDFAAVLREVCTDNEASIFTASLLRNMGVPGVIISPKGTDANPGNLTKDQRNEFRDLWNEMFTGERRGEPFIQSIPVDVTMPGFSPQQMVLDKLHSIPEQRICGSFGIPASVLQLGTGLENSNTKAGKGDDREQAYESCVIPTLYAVARTLNRSLAPEFGVVTVMRVWFDVSEVRCLQEDENEVIKTLVLACGGPFLTVNEARTKRGVKSIAGAQSDAVRAGKGATDGSDPNGDEPDGSDETRGETSGKKKTR